MKAGTGGFQSMRRSWIAALGFAVLGLASMGTLGGMLYYAVYPVLGPWHGSMDSWQPQWKMVAAIVAAVLWASGFLVAGLCYDHLERRGLDAVTRRVIYVVVLWLAAVLAWAVVLWHR